jgi:exopolyphosphatase/guanosine-5'-triphosphate,3'-diphosphate pyrophosphatase
MALESGTPAAFPVVLGAVDVGSNAVRFAAAEFTARDRFRILDSDRAPVRLGHEVFLTGKLGSAAMDAGIAALRQFGERLTALGAVRSRAVATSAVREASNGAEFLERARAEAGFDLKAVTGAEEARLVHLAASSRVELGEKPWLLADLGGGSVEVSLVDATGIRWSESHTMGSVRLLEELAVVGEEPGRFFSLLEEYASTIRIPRAEVDRPKGFLATGGNAESLAELAGAAPDARGVSRVPLGDLQKIIEILAKTPYRNRMEVMGLCRDRADVILPAALIYSRLGALTSASEMVVPHVGVREGILLDLATEAIPGGGEIRLDRQAFQAALALGRKYAFDEAHGRHVSKLAVSLFDQLESVHGLGPDSRRVLRVAALLHDVGSFVSPSGHHKHSLYILANSGLLGFSPEEVPVVANVARYHRKGAPSADHEMFHRLSKPDRQRTLRLAALLRIADALDREHLQRVHAVEVRRTGCDLRLRVSATGDLVLETWSLKRKVDFFEKVYAMKTTLETSRGGGHESRTVAQEAHRRREVRRIDPTHAGQISV